MSEKASTSVETESKIYVLVVRDAEGNVIGWTFGGYLDLGEHEGDRYNVQRCLGDIEEQMEGKGIRGAQAEVEELSLQELDKLRDFEKPGLEDLTGGKSSVDYRLESAFDEDNPWR